MHHLPGHILALLLTFSVAAPLLAAERDDERISAEGRFIYANDDDWDWATPAGAEPCRLGQVYGRMKWSALDWIEGGLPKVDAALIGTPPTVGDYLSMKKLNVLRGHGDKPAYRQVDHAEGVVVKLLASASPPNVLTFMRDTAQGAWRLNDADVDAIARFVRRGGRVLVLDDWSIYDNIPDYFLRALPKLPAPTQKDAPPAKGDAFEKRARELVAKLGDDDYRVRVAATEALIKLGKDVLPLIGDIESDDAEVRMRLAIVRSRFGAAVPSASATPANEVQVKSNADVQQLARQLKAGIHTVDVQAISRNGKQELGQALRFRWRVERVGNESRRK